MKDEEISIKDVPIQAISLIRVKNKKWLGKRKATVIVGTLYKVVKEAKKVKCFKCSIRTYILEDDTSKDFVKKKFKVMCPICAIRGDYSHINQNSDMRKYLMDNIMTYIFGKEVSK